jgi:hypothetical protein
MSEQLPPGHKFHAGRTRSTQAALQAMQNAGYMAADLLARHVTGNWGDHDAEQKAANDAAVANGGPIHSIYHLPGGQEVWVFTEADRSMTTILLPSDQAS